MVGEFPELQGLMGRYYAKAAGLAPEVAAACEEHYKPLGPGDAVPAAPVSVAVALAFAATSIASSSSSSAVVVVAAEVSRVGDSGVGMTCWLAGVCWWSAVGSEMEVVVEEVEGKRSS